MQRVYEWLLIYYAHITDCEYDPRLPVLVNKTPETQPEKFWWRSQGVYLQLTLLVEITLKLHIISTTFCLLR